MPAFRSRLRLTPVILTIPPRAGWAFLLWLACATAVGAAGQPVDRRAEIRNLYAAANYEETLSLLALLDSSPESSVGDDLRDDLDEYRALCLLALAREADAERAMRSLVTRHPLSLDRLEERSPKFVTLYQQVRAKMAPQLAAAAYAAGKQHYDTGDYTNARVRLRDALSLLKYAPGERSAAELEMLASGFLALAERPPVEAPVVTAAQAPVASPVPLAASDPVVPILPPAPATSTSLSRADGVAAMTAEGAPAAAALPSEPPPALTNPAPPSVEPPLFAPVPRLYTSEDSDVIPPAVIDQTLPRWSPPHDLLRRRSFTGRVQVIIGADGRVKAADIIQPSFGLYDEQVLRATRQWRYQPATKRGFPVEYKRIVEFTLSGQ